MLPVRLELRNFLAYRAPAPVSFEGLTLACLSGPNGAGKSSLLDAMTWAIWGRARGKTDDEMIHMGQEEMHVIFDFRQDQALYRVVRKRSKKGRGQGSLDFFVWDAETHQFRLISESSIRDTQNRIIQLLRLDYETFIHSAFLQQGRADLFTTTTPARRKEILADILGLSRWDKYEKQAKEALKDIEDQLRVIEVRIEEIEREEGHEPSLRHELSAATQQVAEARQAREAADALLAEVAGAPQAMQGAQAQLVAAQRRIRDHEQDIARLDAELTQQQERLTVYQDVIAKQDSIAAGYAELESARQTDYELGYKLTQQARLKDPLTDLKAPLHWQSLDIE